MAPEGPNDDFEFIMTCLKYTDSKTKPNFNLVAKEIGAKSANAAYHRHWGIMKKYGLAGGGIGRVRLNGIVGLSADNSAPATKPRGRKPKVAKFDADSGEESNTKDPEAIANEESIGASEMSMEDKDTEAITRDKSTRKKKAPHVKLEEEDLADESE